MSGFVSFPESETYFSPPSSYVNIYDRVKDAASSVVSTLMAGAPGPVPAATDSSSIQGSIASVANQAGVEPTAEPDAETEPSPPPPSSTAQRPSGPIRSDTSISIAPVSGQSVSSSVGFTPSVTTATVGISSEPSIPMLTGVPSITVDNASEAFGGDAESIMSTVSYSRAYLSAQYSRSSKGPVDALSKEFWMKDENATSCFRCSRPFTTFRRRHHCRICGQIFCSSCTRVVSTSALGGMRSIRCCDNCDEALHAQNSSSDEEDTTAVSFVGSYPDTAAAAVLRRGDDHVFRNPFGPRTSGNVLSGEYLEAAGGSDDEDDQNPLANSFSGRALSTPSQTPVHFTRPRSNTNRSQKSMHHLVKFPLQTSSIDLSSAAVHHTEVYIRQLIHESELPNSPWSDVLLAPLYTAAASIHPEFLQNQINPRHWIKIKRICGGTPQDIECINGTVFTHAFAQRIMPTRIQYPRLLLITFPIEYSRGVGEYMSLDPILAQEKEYLKKLVARIEGLKPTMVLSTTTISGTALEMLSAAGIAVACSVPDAALHRLARYTQADVLTSIDRLSMNPRLGFCAEAERRLYRYNDTVKSFLFFTGISANSGCTIILRGEEEELERVKLVMETMVVVVTSLKLETALMRDQFVLLPTQDDGPILSSSPFVDFGRPYLQRLTQQLEDEVVRARPTSGYDPEKEPLPSSSSRDEDWAARASELGVENLSEIPGGESLLRRFVHDVQSNRHERAHFMWNRAQDQWELLEKQNPYVFSPMYHQSLVLIFASLCRPAGGLICVGPETAVMDYYLESDLTLGQWIEQFCHTSNDSCPENCGYPLSQHDRVYIHGEGRLSCSVEEHECPMPGMTDTILMWSFCTKCNQAQPVVPMSASTWKYSLGKYFELSFWGKPLSLRAGACPHNIYRDHIRYFGWHNLVVKINYEPIELYAVETPSPKMHADLVGAINYKIKTYLSLRTQLCRVWDSVSFCVKQIKLEGLEEEKMAEGVDTLGRFALKAESDRDASLKLLDETFVISDSQDTLALNEVLLHVQTQVEKWHQDFSLFDGMFFPTEKDIRRVTAQHLRSLFLDDDKLNEEGPSSNNSLAPPAEISGSQEPALAAEPVKENTPSSPDDHDGGTSPIQIRPRPELSPQKSTSSVLVQTEFGNPIEFHVGSLESTAAKAQIEPKKRRQVSLLVEHFEELSREFERERIRERQRLKERRDALTLKHAPPVAEIFQDVNDAVEEDWNDDETDSAKKSAGGETSSIHGSVSLATTERDNDSSNAENISDTESRSVLPIFERNSLIKSLVSFWAERSSTRWSGIEYMLSPTEHLFNDSLVVIREDEPSSVISFCLSLPDYQQRIRAAMPSNADEKATLEQLILKQTGIHMRYHFEERQTKVSCKIFFSEQFDAIRRQCGVDHEYLQSLSRCIPWEGNGGKSGSTFLKTQNDRFILKELSQPEFDAFVSIAPSYFDYTAQSLFHDLPSILARIFGFYQIQVRNVNRQYKLYVMVMENLFYGKDNLRIFDLKGSMRNRKVTETGKANEVLLDENMVEYIHEHPLFVREHTKKLLRTSLYNDSLFLTKMNVMDYSLIIGIDQRTHKVHAGLVDFVRTYTWDKKIESWVKGRTTTRVAEPTVISPRQYKVRFRESMEQYFLMVPDCWSELGPQQSLQPDDS